MRRRSALENGTIVVLLVGIRPPLPTYRTHCPDSAVSIRSDRLLQACATCDHRDSTYHAPATKFEVVEFPNSPESTAARKQRACAHCQQRFQSGRLHVPLDLLEARLLARAVPKLHDLNLLSIAKLDKSEFARSLPDLRQTNVLQLQA